MLIKKFGNILIFYFHRWLIYNERYAKYYIIKFTLRDQQIEYIQYI